MTPGAYVFYRGIGFDLAPCLNQPFSEVRHMASRVWGITIKAGSPEYLRLHRTYHKKHNEVLP